MNQHDERSAIADTLETISDALAAAGHHREADELHALAHDLRTPHRGEWEAVFDHDDGRYLHLGYGPDEPTVQARATAWALSFGGRLDWHDPWPDGTRQADFIAPDQDPGTGIEVRPSSRHDRQRRFNEHQREVVIRLRDERDEVLMRLGRIGNGHGKHVTEHGTTSGYCHECGHPWPCPTNTWATTKRDLDLCWDPFDDEPPAPQPEPDEYVVTVQRIDGYWVGSIAALGLAVQVDHHDDVDRTLREALDQDGRNAAAAFSVTYS
ncbi:hypothetical protein B4N89_27375 [Embleya scabrispora]|uniref:Uncharacterized protein n=1 Tax=Embleya scabrispora TaxID=159449 RepID=A0A1T3P5B3_9ACTN|nr:hypothetical protein [Embleya scabrispora]OPC84151.1 hypothetical protein B4N89_27375 [Embleya scabrispora]